MEVTGGEVMTALLAAARTQSSGRGPRRANGNGFTPVYAAPAAKTLRRRCTCGTCRSCLDNSRWERIFQEKFADPNYCTRPLRRGSSLGW